MQFAQLEQSNSKVSVARGERLFSYCRGIQTWQVPCFGIVIMWNACLYKIIKEVIYSKVDFTDEDGICVSELFEVYGCTDSSGRKHKAKCLYKYNDEKDVAKNKGMEINEQR